MPYRCRTGLFIGVDAYSDLEDDRQLQGAGADAARTRDYFRRASPGGEWELVVDDGTRQATRTEVLAAIQDSVGRVKSGDAGLLFFAGHGFVVNGNLVLACCDFRPSAPYDSGIPLSRVMEIIRRSATDTRFIVLLACCREGSDSVRPEWIPAHASVLFSCSHGGAVLESKRGSVVVNALLHAADRLAVSEGGGAPGCTADELVRRMMDRLVEAAPGVTSRPEWCGGSAAEIRIPLNVVAQTAPVETPHALCMARTMTMSVGELNRVRRFLGNAVMRLHGFPIDHLRREEILQPYVQTDEGSCRCDVQLPATDGYPSSWMVLEHLLHQFPASFEEIVVRWTSQLQSEHFRRLLSDGDQPRLTKDGDRFQISWSSREYGGALYVMSSPEGGTVGRVTCQNREGILLPLDYLLPSFERIYRRLIAIGKKGGLT